MKRTDQTLLEQMRINEMEIRGRMDLLEISTEELDFLHRQQVVISDKIDEIVDEFYQVQTGISEISLLIGDADTLQRLKAAQRRYISDLFAGHYDEEYVNNRLRIGMVHKRIGVEPKLYLSAVRVLKEIIANKLRDAIHNEDVTTKTLIILDKLFYFDVTLVFDTYIVSLVEAIENEKKRTETYAKSLEEKVLERTHQLETQVKMDSLTNIYNQRAMQEFLRRELLLSKRNQTHLSILYIDVDDFKHINDQFGHVKGDEVLKNLALSLIKSIRGTDVPCRYGGDEFCIILPNCAKEEALRVAEAIEKDFSRRQPDVSISIGVAENGPTKYLDEDGIIRAADASMYDMKNKKKESKTEKIVKSVSQSLGKS